MEQPTCGVARVAGEPGRYHVDSSDPRNPAYLVDICENDANGWCGCRNFEIVHQPAWQRGEPGKHRCKHIIAAMLWECEEGAKLWNLCHGEREDGP